MSTVCLLSAVPLQENRSFDFAAKWRRPQATLRIHQPCSRSTTHTSAVVWQTVTRTGHLHVARYALRRLCVDCGWREHFIARTNSHSCGTLRRPHLTKLKLCIERTRFFCARFVSFIDWKTNSFAKRFDAIESRKKRSHF